jgi:very-long-chain enoyl-CoA reductase
VDDVKARFAELKPRYYPSRQRFTLPLREGRRSAEALASGKKLSDYGLQDGSVLLFKDLGPQVHAGLVGGQAQLPPASLDALCVAGCLPPRG